MAKFELTDDGTMDTVVRCSECGEEMRFNYDPGMRDDLNACETVEDIENSDDYEAFIDECITTAEDEHECPNEEPTEPQDEDITTTDHMHFYYCGRQIVACGIDANWQQAVGTWCKLHSYFPNVWFISDYGNAVLISVADDGRYLAGYADV